MRRNSWASGGHSEAPVELSEPPRDDSVREWSAGEPTGPRAWRGSTLGVDAVEVEMAEAPSDRVAVCAAGQTGGPGGELVGGSSAESRPGGWRAGDSMCKSS